MTTRSRRYLAAVALGMTVLCAGCAAVPDPPEAVGENYPGTCLPPELSWPSDFLGSLAGESSAVGGAVVGLRLEYIDSDWVWRLRSHDTPHDAFGERVDDASFGKESLVDVRTLETLATHQVQLTEAEQHESGSGAWGAAKLSGEQWPSPLIIEMARVMQGETAVWRITTCDTETNEQHVMTVD
ncbi:hypothetical protein AB1K54_06525 [Microbacterium sp. BWT-B31]|uniref:hypothetical protein n=1 Tax=Microbacterium sp. BWT-B31 TaxID=3232072 RepID=UPI0035280259